jgi:hypothetical protein
MLQAECPASKLGHVGRRVYDQRGTGIVDPGTAEEGAGGTKAVGIAPRLFCLSRERVPVLSSGGCQTRTSPNLLRSSPLRNTPEHRKGIVASLAIILLRRIIIA